MAPRRGKRPGSSPARPSRLRPPGLTSRQGAQAADQEARQDGAHLPSAALTGAAAAAAAAAAQEPRKGPAGVGGGGSSAARSCFFFRGGRLLGRGRPARAGDAGPALRPRPPPPHHRRLLLRRGWGRLPRFLLLRLSPQLAGNPGRRRGASRLRPGAAAAAAAGLAEAGALLLLPPPPPPPPHAAASTGDAALPPSRPPSQPAERGSEGAGELGPFTPPPGAAPAAFRRDSFAPPHTPHAGKRLPRALSGPGLVGTTFGAGAQAQRRRRSRQVNRPAAEEGAGHVGGGEIASERRRVEPGPPTPRGRPAGWLGG